MTARLRELAASWKRKAGFSDGKGDIAFALGRCADELLSILDAEGDGGAVGELVRTAPEQIYLQISDNQGDHEDAFPANYGDEITWCADSVFDCEVKYVRADLAHPDPARSGVVRDEDVDLAVLAHHTWCKDAGFTGYVTCRGAMRAALEHFARRTP